MIWYYAILILIGIFIYLPIGITITYLLIEVDDDLSATLASFFGIIWPVTLIMLFELYCAGQIMQQNDKELPKKEEEK